MNTFLTITRKVAVVAIEVAQGIIFGLGGGSGDPVQFTTDPEKKTKKDLKPKDT